jgi:hypothetical protein
MCVTARLTLLAAASHVDERSGCDRRGKARHAGASAGGQRASCRCGSDA